MDSSTYLQIAHLLDGRSVAVTRCGGRVGALVDDRPHRSGPPGEGMMALVVAEGLALLHVHTDVERV